MKVLSLHGYFVLPDGFTGNLSDALRLFSEYHENQNTMRKRDVSGPTNEEKTDQQDWDNFLRVVNDGKKVFMRMGVSDQDSDGNWSIPKI